MSQVKWVETAYERGAEDGTTRWTAILSIKSRPPRSTETLRRNPLGIYVDAIDWSRELEVAPASPPVSPPAPPSAGIPSGSPIDPTLSNVPPPLREVPQ